MLHQPFQASRDMTCIRLEFIQMGLDQLLTIEDQVTWNCQDIFDKSRGVESGQWPIWEHPITRIVRIGKYSSPVRHGMNSIAQVGSRILLIKARKGPRKSVCQV